MDFSQPLLQSGLTKGCNSEDCDPNPCENGGKCFGNGKCDCPPEFTGSSCAQGILFVILVTDTYPMDNCNLIFFGILDFIIVINYFVSLHFQNPASGSVTFFGKEFISYRILNTAVQPVKRNAVRNYRTAQNTISLSFTTNELHGTLLQLGDPESSEYGILEVLIQYFK